MAAVAFILSARKSAIEENPGKCDYGVCLDFGKEVSCMSLEAFVCL